MNGSNNSRSVGPGGSMTTLVENHKMRFAGSPFAERGNEKFTPIATNATPRSRSADFYWMPSGHITCERCCWYQQRDGRDGGGVDCFVFVQYYAKQAIYHAYCIRRINQTTISKIDVWSLKVLKRCFKHALARSRANRQCACIAAVAIHFVHIFSRFFLRLFFTSLNYYYCYSAILLLSLTSCSQQDDRQEIEIKERPK